MAFFSTFICSSSSALLPAPHTKPITPRLLPNKQAPLHLYPHGLHYWAEKNTDGNAVFCPLPVPRNMLVIIISFTILGLLLCHFFPLSSVNSRNWLLNYYSGLCNGADSRGILLFFFFFLTTGYDL